MAVKDPKSPEEKRVRRTLCGEGMGDLQGLLAFYECFVRASGGLKPLQQDREAGCLFSLVP